MHSHTSGFAGSTFRSTITGARECPLKRKENAMAVKVVLSLGMVFAVLLAAGIAVRGSQHATASSSSKASVVTINKLESTIDLKALPRQTVNYVD
jgi:hypothetical protein